MVPVGYSERPVGRGGAVVWSVRRDTAADELILPDACLDLVWDGETLLVAGPDTRARRHATSRVHVGLRLPCGLGPGLLGVPADELSDRLVDLADVWGHRRATALAERVADDPFGALARCAAAATPDPFAVRVLAAAAGGRPAGELADDLGYTVRTVHRRCRALFGYGPQHLRRVLRLQRVLVAARGGLPLSDAAAHAGYADQPHLARDVRTLAGTTPTGLVAARGRVREDGQPDAANRSTVTSSGPLITA